MEQFLISPIYHTKLFYKFRLRKTIDKNHLITANFKFGTIKNIYYILFNKFKNPSFQDNLIMYFIGRGSCAYKTLFEKIEFFSILSNYGTVLLCDYNKSCSNKMVSFPQIYKNILNIGDYFLENNIDFDNLLVFGHSLGTIFATYFCNYVINDLKKNIRGLILWSPLYSLEYLVKSNYVYQKFCKLFLTSSKVDYLTSKYNCYKLKYIYKKVKIVIIHGVYDAIISFALGYDIAIKYNIPLLTTYESHIDIVLDNDKNNFFNSYLGIDFLHKRFYSGVT